MKYLIAILVLLVLVGCAAEVKQVELPQPDVVEVVESAPIETESDKVMITIKNFAFEPEEVTVSRGTRVVWVNKDAIRHTATSDDDQFDSPLLAEDEEYTFVFNEFGEFGYHCRPHPSMTGKIIVE